MVDADAPAVSNLTHTCWRDDSFFRQWALTQQTVLDYFARSPFYVPTCNNEECKRQGLSLDLLRTLKPGVEFVLASCQEPVLYVIKRQYRQSPERTRQEAFYYVLHGTIYMAPSLHACMTSRMDRCLFNLEAAFDILKHDLEPLEWKERQRVKRLRAADASAAARRTAAAAATDEGAQPAKRQRLPAGAADAGVAEGVAEAGADAQTRKDLQDLSGAAAAATEEEGHAAEGYALPSKPYTRKEVQWIQQTDAVVLNVLSRFEVPLYSAPEAPPPSQPPTPKPADGQTC